MAKRTLNDSFVFSMLIKNEKLTNMIKNINLQRDAVNPEVLRDSIDQIRKISCPTKTKIIELIQQGRIKFIYNPGSITLPPYMSVLGIRKPGDPRPVFVVDVNRRSKGNIDSGLTMNPRTLCCLLQNAVLLNEFSERWEVVANNDNLRKNGSIAYSKLATKILIKLYAVDNDPMKSDLIRFMFAKFYLLNMSGVQMDERALNDIAYASCMGGTSKTVIENMEKDINNRNTKKAYENLNTLFAAMKDVPGLFSLNMRSFTENWTRMYGPGSAMSIDYLPSFLNMIFSTVLLGGIVSDPIVSNICGREISGAYSAFAKMCN